MPKLTTESFQAITRVRYLGGKRPILWATTKTGQLVQVKHISVADLGVVEFHRVTGWWAQFDAWQGWKDGGSKGPRPKVWRVVPLFAWQLRRDILKARVPINTHPAPKPPPTEPPPLPPRAARYVNLIFAAQNPLAALAAKPKYRVLFTADPGYDDWATVGAANALRDAGHDIGVWYVPTQVSRSRAQEVAARLNTDFVVGQSETLPEFQASWEQGCRSVIGNLSAVFDNPDAASKISSGEMIFVNEFYWNQDRSRKSDNHGLPVPSLCVAFYDGHSDSSAAEAWAPHAGDYQQAGYWWPTMSAYGPGATADDYRALP